MQWSYYTKELYSTSNRLFSSKLFKRTIKNYILLYFNFCPEIYLVTNKKQFQKFNPSRNYKNMKVVDSNKNDHSVKVFFFWVWINS